LLYGSCEDAVLRANEVGRFQQGPAFCQLHAIRHLRRNAIKWIPASAGIQR